MKQIFTAEAKNRMLVTFARIARACIALLMIIALPGIKYTAFGVSVGLAFGVMGILLSTHIIRDCADQEDD